MNKKIFVLAAALFCVAMAGIFAQSSSESAEEQVIEQADNSKSFKYIAACLAVGFSCIAGGMAVGKIGAAAMGAMSENSELSGKALPFVGLAEGICLWGFLVALLIIILG
ncbi:MAG: ATP synthase subunit C [Treponemataceae bacterium]|nr:ATP synthase subunit C [Treponemataceae bacterium]MDE5775962.1 ATP synthase subunit C [Treponemataceae bacterium]MDE7292377.1 ATP synthase subunit C [Treponemataceae bacterium]